MQIPEVYNSANAEITRAMKKFQKEIEALIAQMSDKGVINFTPDNFNLAFENYSRMYQVIEEAGLSTVRDNIIASESATIRAFREFKFDGSVPFSLVAEKDVVLIQALQDSEFLQLAALERQAADAVYSTLVDSIVSGQQSYDAILSLEKTIDTQTRYINTWYETSRQQYDQKLQDLSAENYKNEFGGEIYWEYIGAPLDEKTRHECELALRKLVFTDAEKQAFETGDLFDAKNPRYNCRHIFWNITERRYREIVGQIEA
jgi:hypothetical protein